MSQWQSLCLALVLSLTPASAAFSQAAANAPEIQSGDVWLVPSDLAYPSPVVLLPQVSTSNGDSPTGDVWLVPDRQEAPALAAEGSGPRGAALATTNE
jgi:hypothetical protein